MAFLIDDGILDGGTGYSGYDEWRARMGMMVGFADELSSWASWVFEFGFEIWENNGQSVEPDGWIKAASV
jgi:hypothetical protein